MKSVQTAFGRDDPGVATSITLIDDVARKSGVPRPTVRSYVERLRADGLIVKSGRRGGAPIKTKDAAALLAAMLVRPTIVEAAAAARTVLSLPLNFCYCSVAGSVTRGDKGHIDLADAGHADTLGDMLRRLLTCAANCVAKGGVDTQGWENLFKPDAPQDSIVIMYFREPRMCQVVLRAAGGFVCYIFNAASSCPLQVGAGDRLAALISAAIWTCRSP